MTGSRTRSSHEHARPPELLGERRFDPARFASRAEYRAARAALWAGFINAGATMAEVAGAAGLSIQTVRRILKQEGYVNPRKSRRLPARDPLAVLRALRHPAASSLGATAKLAGVPVATARHILRSLLLEPAAKRLWRARTGRAARRRRRDRARLPRT
jgi:AraC-like DNA-binding protein